MNTRIAYLVGGCLAFLPMVTAAQEAGSVLLGVSTTELREIATGWSVKKTVLGHEVYNEADEKVGTIDDLIVSPGLDVSFAILNAGGFLKVAKHDVAIPITAFELMGDKMVLEGATHDALKALPVFEYAK